MSESSRLTPGADGKDDARLIQQVLDGEGTAFERLVLKHQDRLFNTMIRLTGRREEAEDVVQDAFIQAYLKLDSFQGQSAFYTWLYRIAFNTAVSRRRKKRAEVSVDLGRDLAGAEPLDSGESPVECLERKERAAQLEQALALLSEEHRAILVLREMEGHCYETIADILNVPVGTVRSRLHRARLQLRDEVTKIQQPPNPTSASPPSTSEAAIPQPEKPKPKTPKTISESFRQ